MLLLGRGGKHGGVVGLWRIACHGRLIVLHFLASISAHHVTNFDTDVAFVVHAHSQTVAAVAPLLIIIARIGVLGFLDVFDIVFVVANLCFQLSNERRCGRVVAFHQRRRLPCCAAHERQVIIASAGVDIVPVPGLILLLPPSCMALFPEELPALSILLGPRPLMLMLFMFCDEPEDPPPPPRKELANLEEGEEFRVEVATSSQNNNPMSSSFAVVNVANAATTSRNTVYRTRHVSSSSRCRLPS